MAEHELSKFVDGSGEVFNFRDFTKIDRYNAVYSRLNTEGGGWVKLADLQFTNTYQVDKPAVWRVVIARCLDESSTEELCLNVRYNSSSLPSVFFKRFYTIDRTETHKFAVVVGGEAGVDGGKVELWAYLEKFWGSIAISEIAGGTSTSLYGNTNAVYNYYSYKNEGGASKPVADLANSIQVVDSTNIQLQTDENLVTSWSSTTSDSKYPSEKLVKADLDRKQDAIGIDSSSGDAVKYLNQKGEWKTADQSFDHTSGNSQSGKAINLGTTIFEGGNSDAYYVTFASLTMYTYFNHPIVIRIQARYSSPILVHILPILSEDRFGGMRMVAMYESGLREGSNDKISKIGYSYQDSDSGRTYKFWSKQPKWSPIDVRILSADSAIMDAVSIVTNTRQSTEPLNVTWVDVVDYATSEGTYPYMAVGSATEASAAASGSSLAQDLAAKEVSSNKVTSWQGTPDDTHYPSELLVKGDLDKKLDRYDARYARGTQDGDGWVKLAETGNFTTTRQIDKPFVWDVIITSCQKETSLEQLCLNVQFETSGLPNVFFKRFYTIDRLDTHKFAVRVIGAAGSENGNIELWAYHEKKWGTIAIRESVAAGSITLAPTKLYGTYYSYYSYGGTSKPESDLANNIQVVDSTNVKYQTDVNLVTSWSSTTSDSRYPSEKLVKTSLDNIKLFQAEYGVTSFADIYAAITSNKIVYCKVGGRMAFLAYLSVSNPPNSSSSIEFQYYRSNSAGTGDSVFVYKITNNNNTWTTTERPAYVISDWNAASGSASFIANKPQAYNSTPEYVGTVGSAGNSTNWSRGNHVHPISLAVGDIPGTVKIAGQNVHVNGLVWCENEGRFVIDIHGSATSLKADTPIYYESTAMYIPVQTTVPAGYSSWSDVFTEAVTRWGNKGRIYAIVGGTAPGVSTVKYEKHIPASYIFVPSGETTPDYIMFTEVTDDLYDTPSSENRGLIRVYTLNRNGWSSTPSSFWPSYAERALNDGYGNSLLLGISNNVIATIGGKNLYAATAGSATSAGSATNATNATNDGSGNNIVNTYAKKQAFVNLGSISKSIATSSSTSWTPIYIHDDPVSYSIGKPHIYTACLNIVGYTQQYGNFATALIALTLGIKSPDAAPSETLLMFAPVIQSGMSSVPVTLSAPFTIGGSENFRPRLWIKLDQVSSPFSVNGNHYFHSIST